MRKGQPLTEEHRAKLRAGRKRAKDLREKGELPWPITVRGRIRLARVYLTPTGFMRWRLMMGISLKEATHILGLGIPQVESYETGKRQIPKVVELACAAYALGLRYYEGPQDHFIEMMRPKPVNLGRPPKPKRAKQSWDGTVTGWPTTEDESDGTV